MRPNIRCKYLVAGHNFFFDSILPCKILDIKSTFCLLLFIDTDVILRTISILTYMNLLISVIFASGQGWPERGWGSVEEARHVPEKNSHVRS